MKHLETYRDVEIFEIVSFYNDIFFGYEVDEKIVFFNTIEDCKYYIDDMIDDNML